MKEKFNTLKISLLLWGLLSPIAFSCDKTNNDSTSTYENMTGLVLDFGNPAVDGCGWMLEINKAVYSPINLDSTFKIDSLQVIVDYKLLSTTWNCGWQSTNYKKVEILNIKKQK